MAFACWNYDSIKSGVYGTAALCVLAQRESNFTTARRYKMFNCVNWTNLGNFNTSGTSSTSGTGGTTIIAAGNYTWIG